MKQLLTMLKDKRAAVAADLGANMRINSSLFVLAVMSTLWVSTDKLFGAQEEGVALGIVYDTSGSMRDPARDKDGKDTSKFIIANRALIAIADRIQNFSTNAAAGGERRIDAGLY